MFLDKKKSVGLDISDTTIEAVEMATARGKAEVVSRGRVILEPGIVINGRIKNPVKLANALKQVFGSASPKPINPENVVFGLPDSLVYILCLDINLENSENIRILINKELESIIPIDSKRLIYSYRILEPDRKNSRTESKILLAAAEEKAVWEWKNFFRKIKLDINLFDIEPLAIFRGINKEFPEKTTVLVDIGARTTNISFFSSLGMTYSYEVQYGGDYFNKKIADGLKIDIKKADIIKTEKGIDSKGKGGKILATAFKHLSEEIKRNIGYYNEKYNDRVEEIIFVGGSSKIKGLIEFLNSQDFNLELKLGKALYVKEEAFVYIEAIGLAVRGLYDNWSKTDPFIEVNKKIRKSALLKSSAFKKIIIIGSGVILIAMFLFFLWPIIGKYFRQRNLDNKSALITAQINNEKPLAPASSTPNNIESAVSTEEEIQEPVKKINLTVLNGSGRAGVAGNAAQIINQAGIATSTVGNAENFNYSTTTIKYKKSFLNIASQINKLFTIEIEMREVADQAEDIIVIMGKNY